MKRWITAALLAGSSLGLHAAPLTIDIHEVSAQGTGPKIGTVSVEQNEHGLVFRPELGGLQAGIHGFHVHANPSCGPAEKDGKTIAAGAAGGHWDPQNAGKHGEPWGDGHLGDLPALLVTADGKANQPVLAPRLKDLDQLKGHALMIHQGGDNHSDHPEPLGGGGARVACGVIE